MRTGSSVTWLGSHRRLANVDRRSLKPFLTLSSVALSVILGSSLTKNLTFQYILINLPVVATINFTSCVLFPVSRSLSHDAAATLVHAFVTSRLDHCCSVLVGLPLMLTAHLDRVLHSAARLIGGFPFDSASFTKLLCWCGTCLLSIAPVVQELCRPVSTLIGRQALRSSSGGKLLVPCVNTSTMQRRAFSVVAPSIWNSLPSQI